MIHQWTIYSKVLDTVDWVSFPSRLFHFSAQSRVVWGIRGGWCLAVRFLLGLIIMSIVLTLY